MFDVGFWELGLIAVIALIILGPERLPRAARTAGLWVGRARRMMAEVKTEIKREVDAQELAEVKKIGDDLKDAGGAFGEVASSMNEVIGEEAKAAASGSGGEPPVESPSKQPDEPATRT